MSDNTQQEKFQPILSYNDLQEAGGVAFCQITKTRELEDGTEEVLEINLTARGWSAADALTNLREGLHYASELGYNVFKKVNRPPRNNTQTPAPATAVNPPLTPPGTGVIPPQVSGSMISPPAGTGGVIHAVKLVTTPREDGKVSLDFFETNHKFADLKKVCSIENAIQTLSPIGSFTPQHFGSVQTYVISADVRWIESENRNSKGNPYKNIVDIVATE